MKIRKIILAIACVFAALAFTAFPACGVDKTAQKLNYKESTAAINNPDQGFYRPVFVKANASGVTYNKNIINNSTQLYHLRIDISAFSKAVNGRGDELISKNALNGLNGLLAYLKSRDKNAVVRFAYDPYYDGAKNKEPSPEMIAKHIEQVCPVLNEYENTVTAVEVGLIGPWGEMHSSAIANAEHITPIIGAFLDNTESIPVLVRTPKMIYDYLGIALKDIENYTISAQSKAYRLGLFNDGYLGSDNDLGTYSDREKEIEFLSGQTNHLPFGGEVVIPSSKLHDIDVCLPEMFKINLSYLNIEWNNQVIDKWKNSSYTKSCGSDKHYYGETAFNYIQNRLGYRFVLTRSELNFSEGGKLNIKLNIANVGFGNLNRTKRTKLIVADGDGKVVLAKDLQNFTGEENFNAETVLSLQSGKYDIYLRVYGEEAESVPLYCVQFANDGLWNGEIKANKIGSIEA